MFKLSVKEVDSVSALDVQSRYKYFIKRIADMQELVILINQNETHFFDTIDGKPVIHFWSGIEYAEIFLKNNNLNLEVSAVDFDYLGQVLYPEIKANNILLSVMPVNERIGHLLPLNDFSFDLKSYLEENYPDDFEEE